MEGGEGLPRRAAGGLSGPADGDETSLLVRAEELLRAVAPGVEPLVDDCVLAGGLFDELLEEWEGKTLVEPAAAEDEFPDGAALLDVGDRLGSIRLEALVGTGGMGRVLRGFDEKLGRGVAVKSVRPGRRGAVWARNRFRREAQLLSRLNHPGICQVYDLVERPEADYLVFELVDGTTLRAWLATEPPAGERLAAAIAVAEAVDAAHRAGVVHRDLKPENVMRTTDGAVKVLDFGIARELVGSAPAPRPGEPREAGEETGPTAASAEPATDGWVMGTPAYMSPEQRRGEASRAASDVWALGVLLHELLTGRRPEPATEPATEPAQIASGLPAALGALLERMLTVDPAQRPTAAEVVAALRDLALDPQRARSRRRWLAAGMGALLAVAAAVAITVRSLAPEPLFIAGETPRVAVRELVNATGDASYDWVERGLAEMLSDNLARIAGVQVVPFPAVLDYLGDRPRQAGREAELTASLARALGATVVVAARLERDATGLVLRYWADRPAVLGAERQLRGADPFALANELTARLRSRLAPDALVPDLADRFSADPVANRVYAVGLADLRSERAALAEPFFRVAARLDGEMVLADLRLAESLAGQSRPAEVMAPAERVLEVARERGDRGLEAAALGVLATAAFSRDERPLAAELARQAIDVATAAGDREREATATYQLGRTLRFLDPPAARVAVERARQLFEAAGNRLGAGRAVHLLGVLDSEGGDADAAERRYREALAIGEELGAPRLHSVALDSLAIVANSRGDFAGALEILAAARRLAEETGDRRQLVFISNNVGDNHHGLGDLAAAEQAFRQGEAICAAIEAPNPCALLAFNFAELLLITGRPDEALPLIERSEAYYGAGDPDLLYVRALHAAGTGAPGARALLEQAVAGTDLSRGQAYRQAFADVLAARRSR